MSFRSRSISHATAGVALAAILVSILAACGGAAATGAPGPSGSASLWPSGSASPGSSASAGASASGAVPSPSSSNGGNASASVVPTDSVPSGSAPVGASGTPAPSSACVTGLALVHVDPVLEAYLPCTIGGLGLERFSIKLSDYIASSTGGDRDLYAPWLVGFGFTPDDVTMAVDADLTQQENFVIHAIQVPGVADDKLVSSFAEQARKAGWPAVDKTVVSRALVELTDPAAKKAGSLSVGYVYAWNHILFTIITDDPALLVEALIKLP